MSFTSNLKNDLPLCPEIELLLSCARTYINDKRKDRIKKLLEKNINWDYLFWLAHPHLVMPLLYWNLNVICPESIPKPYLNYLSNYFHNNAYNNLFLLEELYNILKLFEKHGIETIPFKGPIFASNTYKNLALRAYVYDLDLIIHKQDLFKAKDLLVSKGYLPEYQLTPAQEASYLDTNGEYTLIKDGWFYIDLQWEIIPRAPIRLNTKYFWKETQKTGISNTTIQTLSPEKMLLALSLDGLEHSWGQLKHICDLGELIQSNPDLNWEQVLHESYLLDIRRILHLSLLLANELLEVNLPEKILEEAYKEQSVKDLAKHICSRITKGTVSIPDEKEKMFFYLKIKEDSSWEQITQSQNAWHPIPNILSNFVPTPKEIAEEMLLLAEVKPDDTVYDLGCGDGRLVIMAAKKYGARCVGIDFDPTRIREARSNAQKEGVEHLITFIQQDIIETDPSQATVIIIYLTNSSNQKLLPMLKNQLKPSTRIISHDNYIGNWFPNKIKWIHANQDNNHSNFIFLWKTGETSASNLDQVQLATKV